MTVIYPEGVTVQGNIGLWVVPAIANPSAPSLAEVTGVGSLNISCMLMGDSWAPTMEQNKGEAPRRLCSKTVVDRFGNVKYTLPDLNVTVDPQAESGDDGVKAYETLTPGLKPYILERLGIDAEEVAWAVGQWVIPWAVELGERGPITGDTSDEFAEFSYTQGLVVRGNGRPGERVKLVI